MKTLTGIVLPEAGDVRRVGARMYVAHAPLAALTLAYYVSAFLILQDVEAELSVSLVRTFFNLRFALIFLGFVAVVYFYFWVILHRSGRSYRQMTRDLWQQTSFVEIFLARFLPVAIAFCVLQTCYVAFKINIPNFVPYSWDGVFAEADRILFLGVDPWVLTHKLLPTATETRVIGVAYGLWFYVMIGAFLVAGVMRLDSRLRMTFLLAFMLGWAVAGSLLATAFSSAGPVYMERLFGDPTFAPLMQRLTEHDAVLEVFSLDAQEDLWKGYSQPDEPAMGISAFPSMHLCIATLVTFFGFGFGRALGWAFAACTALVLIGSVHLGWHYAVDGLAGIALGAAFWWASRRFTDWWFDRFQDVDLSVGRHRPADGQGGEIY